MDKIFNNTSKKKLRQTLRNSMPEPERRLWYFLRNSWLQNIKFRRQESIGPYIVDFYAPSIRLVIEIDGESHADARKYDENRTAFLESIWLRVHRYTNAEVMKNTPWVLEHLQEIITPLLSSPQKGEE